MQCVKLTNKVMVLKINGAFRLDKAERRVEEKNRYYDYGNTTSNDTEMLIKYLVSQNKSISEVLQIMKENNNDHN